LKNFLKENNIKKYKKIFVILFGLLCFSIIFALVYLGCIYSHKNMTRKQATEISLQPFKYDIFVGQWNHLVNNLELSNKAYLTKSDPNLIINELNNHIRSFNPQFSKNIENEFIKFKKKNTYSLFTLYYDFLIKYRIKDKMILTTKMSSLEIKSILYKLTETDSIDEEILKIIFSMDNICNFFNFYKENLYKNGLSRRVKGYNDSYVELKQYPTLHSYLKCY